MLNFFKKQQTTAIQQWIKNNPGTEIDKINQLAKTLIAYSSAFVPPNPQMEESYFKKFYNDNTIIELAIFLLFHYDFFLFMNQDSGREQTVNRVIDYYENVFMRTNKETNYGELINDRFLMYGNKANKNENWLIDTTDLLESLIIETQESKRFLYHKDDDFIMLSLDVFNNSFFKSHLKAYLHDIIEKVFNLYKIS